MQVYSQPDDDPGQTRRNALDNPAQLLFRHATRESDSLGCLVSWGLFTSLKELQRHAARH
jgi:hypothetical protein